MWNRWPLYYALKNKNAKIAFLLLEANADPWSSGSVSYKELIGNDQKLNYFLSKFRIWDMGKIFYKKEQQ